MESTVYVKLEVRRFIFEIVVYIFFFHYSNITPIYKPFYHSSFHALLETPNQSQSRTGLVRGEERWHQAQQVLANPRSCGPAHKTSGLVHFGFSQHLEVAEMGPQFTRPNCYRI